MTLDSLAAIHLVRFSLKWVMSGRRPWFRVAFPHLKDPSDVWSSTRMLEWMKYLDGGTGRCIGLKIVRTCIVIRLLSVSTAYHCLPSPLRCPPCSLCY